MKIFIKNSFFGMLQLLTSIILVFFSIPVFINTYGLNLYGIFSVVSIFGNLTVLLNLGLNTTLLKFISQDRSTILRDIQTTASFLILCFITATFTIAFSLFKTEIVHTLLHIGYNDRTDVILMFQIFVIANVFIMLGQPLIALIQAANDFYLVSILQWTYNLLNWGGIILLSKLKVNFTFIPLAALVSSVTWFFLVWFFAFRRYRFRFLFFNAEYKITSIIRAQFRYSLQVYFNSLLSFFNEPLLKMLVLRYAGASAAGSLDIILKVKAQLVALFTKAFEPLTTIVARQTKKEEIRATVHYTEQVAFFVFIPLCLFVNSFSDFFLKLWLKNINELMILQIKLCIIVFTLSMIVVPNYYFLTFHGRIKDCIKIQLFGICTTMIAFFIAIRYAQDIAPVLGVCIGIVAALLLNLYYQWKYLKSLIFDPEVANLLILLILVSSVSFVSHMFNLFVINFSVIAFSILISGATVMKVIKLGKLGFLK